MDINNKSLNEATPLLVSGQVKDSSNVVECDNAITSTTSDKCAEPMEADTDFFSDEELGITNVTATETITENVEDIVQDLQNLLVESSHMNYTFSKDKLVDSCNEINSSVTLETDTKEIGAEVSDTISDDNNQQDQQCYESNDSKVTSNLDQVTETNDIKVSQTNDNLDTTTELYDKKQSESQDVSHSNEIQINEISTDTTYVAPVALNTQETKEAFAYETTSTIRDTNILNDEFEIFQSALTCNFGITEEVEWQSPLQMNTDSNQTISDSTANSNMLTTTEVKEVSDTTTEEDVISTTSESIGQSTSDSQTDVIVQSPLNIEVPENDCLEQVSEVNMDTTEMTIGNTCEDPKVLDQTVEVIEKATDEPSDIQEIHEFADVEVAQSDQVVTETPDPDKQSIINADDSVASGSIQKENGIEPASLSCEITTNMTHISDSNTVSSVETITKGPGICTENDTENTLLHSQQNENVECAVVSETISDESVVTAEPSSTHEDDIDNLVYCTKADVKDERFSNETQDEAVVSHSLQNENIPDVDSNVKLEETIDNSSSLCKDQGEVIIQTLDIVESTAKKIVEEETALDIEGLPSAIIDSEEIAIQTNVEHSSDNIVSDVFDVNTDRLESNDMSSVVSNVEEKTEDHLEFNVNSSENMEVVENAIDNDNITNNQTSLPEVAATVHVEQAAEPCIEQAREEHVTTSEQEIITELIKSSSEKETDDNREEVDVHSNQMEVEPVMASNVISEMTTEFHLGLTVNNMEAINENLELPEVKTIEEVHDVADSTKDQNTTKDALNFNIADKDSDRIPMQLDVSKSETNLASEDDRIERGYERSDSKCIEEFDSNGIAPADEKLEVTFETETNTLSLENTTVCNEFSTDLTTLGPDSLDTREDTNTDTAENSKPNDCEVPQNITDDESMVTTTEVDIAVHSIMPEESMIDSTAVELVDSNNVATNQSKIETESDSAVEALISAELSDNTIHSNVVEYNADFSQLPQYKSPFITSITPTPKSFEPSMLELNCAVASILGESSSSAISEIEFPVASATDVSTSSIVELQPITEPELDQTIIQEDNESSVLSDALPVTEQPLMSQGDSEQLVTQSNIEEAPRDIENNVEASKELATSVMETEVTTVPSTELGQPLSVQVEDNTTFNDSDVTSTQTEKTETMCQIASPESQKNMSSLKITIGKDETSHSILKIYDPNEAEAHKEEVTIPKITIKPILSPNEVQPSPKLTIKPIKVPEPSSPKITIKPIMKPESISPLKITIRPSKTTPTCSTLHTKSLLETESTHHSPKITIKPIVKPNENVESSGTKSDLCEVQKLGVKTRGKSIEEEEKRSSPKLIIKPILKPQEEEEELQPHSSPRITIKPIIKPSEEVTYPEEIPKITIKPVLRLPEESHSPKITIKPIIKPEELSNDEKHSPRITIKPVLKPNEVESIIVSHLEKADQSLSVKSPEECHSPKITIKPVIKPEDSTSDDKHPPRITFKPVVKPSELEPLGKIHDNFKEQPHVLRSPEESPSPKITIKPVIKPTELPTDDRSSPRITIKPVVKPSEEEPVITSHLFGKTHDNFKEHQPFKLNIKPVVKPDELATTSSEDKQNPSIITTVKPVLKSPDREHSTLRAVLTSSKLNDDFKEQITDPPKLNIKPIVKPPETSILQTFLKSGELPKKPMELIDFEDKIKQERIVLKIKPTRRGRPPLSQSGRLNSLKMKFGRDSLSAQTLEMPSKRSLSEEGGHQDAKQMKFEGVGSELPSFYSQYPWGEQSGLESKPQILSQKKEDYPDPISEIPVFEITPQSIASMSGVVPEPEPIQKTLAPIPAAPRKRGRPRKVPLQVREEFKDPPEDEGIQSELISLTEDSLRPKRTCRGPSARSALGMRPRKPRGSRGSRGGGRSSRSRAPKRSKKESYLPVGSLGLFPEPMVTDCEPTDSDIKDARFKSVRLPTEATSNNGEVVIYEEETRMSAENSSRAQTPAKQVLSSTEVVEESQSSVQSNATTESGEKVNKSRKGSRVEVHHEPEGEVLSADKLAEYSWGGGGPYMLQEQVAQFLGIKSFKRKYPGIHRRTVDMQERDFIRESCLASEPMCDMGLTAVKSEDILDIMYTDFQHKYEEYCKFQRDRQAKDVSNKQKALSLAASQEKNKMDIVEQAVQSAQQWNTNFNKTRREQRRACMDLQTFTVHYPKGKMKQINKAPIGNYPLSLVPGQYSDYYKKYTPRELSSLPLNTVGCGSNVELEDSQSDGSASDSDSSSSDSDSSSSGSSDDCKVCNTRSAITKKQLVR